MEHFNMTITAVKNDFTIFLQTFLIVLKIVFFSFTKLTCIFKSAEKFSVCLRVFKENTRESLKK